MIRQAIRLPLLDRGLSSARLKRWIELGSSGAIRAGRYIQHLTLTLKGDSSLVNALPAAFAYRAFLVAASLFVVSLAVWFALGVKDYTPIAADDRHVLVYVDMLLRENGLLTVDSEIVQRQLPFLQYFVYSSLVWLLGLEFPLVMVPFISSVALALLIGYAAYRFTGEKWAFLVAVLIFISLKVFIIQARSLPFYPPTLLMGYSGLLAAFLFLKNGHKRALIFSVVGLGAGLYAYSIGILFLPLAILYLFAERSRPILIRMTKLYVALTLLAVPFLIWHIAIGGLGGIFKQDLRWMTENGYLAIRNLEFWWYGSETRIEFLSKLDGMLTRAGGQISLPFVEIPIYIPLIALGLIGFLNIKKLSWQIAFFIAAAVPVAALIYKTPPAHAKYVYILFPALVVLAVYGLHAIRQIVKSYRWSHYASYVMGACLFLLVGATAYINVSDDLGRIEDISNAPRQRELAKLALLIKDEKAVLGTRSWSLIPYLHTNTLLATRSVSEDEFVTYLSWTSKTEVQDIFERYDVGWILTRKPENHWEKNFNGWLRHVTDEYPRHYLKLKTTKMVEEVYDGNHYRLYRLTDN